MRVPGPLPDRCPLSLTREDGPMSLPRHAMRAGGLALALAAAATATATVADAATRPDPSSTRLTPSATARAAGITTAGGAYMGWSLRHTGTAGAAPAAEPASATAAEPALSAKAGVTQTPGIDVSSWQGNVAWSSWWSKGKRFAYVKATEGTGYTNPYYSQQFTGSAKVGMYRGAYHFALPDRSAGSTQADYFVSHGGAWSRDGRTLPGALDIEYNPYGATCYGLSQSAMRSWIASFTSRYKARTGRDAVIYSTTDWWTQCTGNTSQFSSTNPLWIARYAATPGTLPTGWVYRTFWQYTDSPIDQDSFNGSLSRLKALAVG